MTPTADPLLGSERRPKLEVFQIAKSDELLRVLVPQRQPQRTEALANREYGHVVKHLILLVTALEPIVRNARAEVVDVV